MKNINASLVLLNFIFGMNAFAGGVGGNGGPPAKEADTVETVDSSLLLDADLGGLDRTFLPKDFLKPITSDDLIKGLDGKVLIPLDNDAIRRLKLRASTTGTTPLVLGDGQRFLLQRDKLKDKLVDFEKAAEVIEKASISTAVESLPSE